MSSENGLWWWWRWWVLVRLFKRRPPSFFSALGKERSSIAVASCSSASANRFLVQSTHGEPASKFSPLNETHAPARACLRRACITSGSIDSDSPHWPRGNFFCVCSPRLNVLDGASRLLDVKPVCGALRCAGGHRLPRCFPWCHWLGCAAECCCSRRHGVFRDEMS